MTSQEFSNQFDILYNNISSNQALGLNEYEKSVFLTKAQTEILNNYFGIGNKYKEGFDESPKRQIDYKNLVTASSPSLYTDNGDGTYTAGGTTITYTKFDDRSILTSLPNDLLYIINETAVQAKETIVNNVTTYSDERLLTLIPVSFDEYMRLMSKPYRQPLKNQGWRLLLNSGNTNIAELIIKYGYVIEPNKYKIRYVRKPKPIILTDLADEYAQASIEGLSVQTECELDSAIHEEILQRAVELAKGAMDGNIKNIVDLGQRSE